MLYCIMLYCAMLYCAMLYCIMLHCIMVRDGGREGLGSASYSYRGVTQTFYFFSKRPF